VIGLFVGANVGIVVAGLLKCAGKCSEQECIQEALDEAQAHSDNEKRL
jgi:uncharacterized membrane-anchored protein YhcB (DUF1043 family)